MMSHVTLMKTNDVTCDTDDVTNGVTNGYRLIKIVFGKRYGQLFFQTL